MRRRPARSLATATALLAVAGLATVAGPAVAGAAPAEPSCELVLGTPRVDEQGHLAITVRIDCAQPTARVDLAYGTVMEADVAGELGQQVFPSGYENHRDLVATGEVTYTDPNRCVPGSEHERGGPRTFHASAHAWYSVEPLGRSQLVEARSESVVLDCSYTTPDR